MTAHFIHVFLDESESDFENYPLANRKTSLPIRGPSPRYFWTNSDPTTRINDAVVWWATAFANIVWKMTSYKVTSSMISNGIWKTYLSATWWTVHEDTTWWINTNLLVEFIMSQWKFNGFTNFLFLSVQTTNIAEMSHHYIIYDVTKYGTCMKCRAFHQHSTL